MIGDGDTVMALCNKTQKVSEDRRGDIRSQLLDQFPIFRGRARFLQKRFLSVE